MKIITRFCFILALMLTVNAFADVKSVDRLSHLLTSFNTYVATYHQLTTNDNGQVITDNRGQMMIKKPGRFRWVSTKPTKQILITDGKSLWVYDVDLSQATKQPLSTRAKIDPAMLLSGSVKNISQIFDVKMENIKNQEIFTLKPKSKEAGFTLVTLTFIKDKLSEMSIVNNLSQTSTFHFHNIKLDTKLPNKLFTFKALKGVDVISK